MQFIFTKPTNSQNKIKQLHRKYYLVDQMKKKETLRRPISCKEEIKHVFNILVKPLKKETTWET
jgi:hypothetical protein